MSTCSSPCCVMLLTTVVISTLSTAQSEQKVTIWRDVIILAADEAHVLQIRADMAWLAESMLNSNIVGGGMRDNRAHPDLESHLGWECTQGELQHALDTFRKAVHLPVQSEGGEARLRKQG